MPAKLPALEYPDRFEVRYVSANGGIRWNSGKFVHIPNVNARESLKESNVKLRKSWMRSASGKALIPPAGST
jgi:hypothetical protein